MCSDLRLKLRLGTFTSMGSTCRGILISSSTAIYSYCPGRWFYCFCIFYASWVVVIESGELKPGIDAILKYLDGSLLDMPLDIYGTEFQVKVWSAIKAIPYRETRSYSEIADDIGMPKACGASPVPLIIPCNRIGGKMGTYEDMAQESTKRNSYSIRKKITGIRSMLNKINC